MMGNVATPARLIRQEIGFSYLMVMIAITLMGLVTTMAARQWKTMVQRELEADLLAKGIEIQTALALYSASAKAGRAVPGEVYPQTLVELTRPPKPFLRKVYLDPVGRGEWELLRAPAGGIMGVRSKSKHKPIKQSNFPLATRHFEGKPTHYDWVFQYPNPSMTALTAPVMLTRPILGQYSASNQQAIPGAPDTPSKPAASEEVNSLGDMNDPIDSLLPENATPPLEPLEPSEILDPPMNVSP